jgi:hypothetical protein
MLTLVAGILMLLGVFGAGVGYEIGAVLAGLIGKTSRFEAGIGFAFLISVIFTIAGLLEHTWAKRWLRKRLHGWAAEGQF